MGSRPDETSLVVWRISNHIDTSGRGGLIVSGRWHTRPRLVMYCSDEANTAYCEMIKQVGAEMFFPDGFHLLEIAVPRTAAVDELDPNTLPDDWSTDFGPGLLACRRIGDDWLKAGSSVLLKVPSAARVGAFNFLMNPVHRDADDFEIVRAVPLPFPYWVSKPPPA